MLNTFFSIHWPCFCTCANIHVACRYLIFDQFSMSSCIVHGKRCRHYLSLERVIPGCFVSLELHHSRERESWERIVGTCTIGWSSSRNNSGFLGRIPKKARRATLTLCSIQETISSIASILLCLSCSHKLGENKHLIFSLKLISMGTWAMEIVKKEVKKSVVDHTYRDYSQVVDISELVDKPRRLDKKNFPSKLHKILSTREYAHIITWRPHGRAWEVMDRPLFISIVLPRYFNHSNFESFNRSVNMWGFKVCISANLLHFLKCVVLFCF